MEAFYKTWELKDQDYDKEAYNSVMKAWDMGFIARKIIESADKPLFRIKESVKEPGKSYLVGRAARSGLGAVRNVVGPMKEGETTDQKRPDGKHFSLTIEIPEPNKQFIQIMKHSEIPEMKITRSIGDDGNLTQLEECGGFSVTKIYVPAPDVESKDDEEL
ncbi:uncharacterized protein LOC142352248 [Convolutriloba macropyga]|uniref:uncharacterized protein LOC142352248 n=1 Tax=Convolutriloba macropyga TaxID=536237 RepID=UPI003F51E4A8